VAVKRRTVLSLVAGVSAVVIVGGVTAWWLLSRSPGPDAAARAFLEALAEGDADTAIALVESPPDGLSDAFGGATGLLSDPMVQSVGSAEGALTRAEVAFTLDGTEHTASFGLVETPEGWRIATDALGAIVPTTTIGDSVRIGDALVPAPGSTGVLPALYAVTAAPTGLLDGQTTVAALPGETVDAAVEASLSPDATVLAQEQIDAYVTACTAPAPVVPDNCGLRVPWAADLATLDAIAFRVEASPVLVIAADARTFAATQGSVVATATGTTREGSTASFTYRADDWALRGSIAFTGDEMVLSVD
jgi:hypothetical protein